MKRASVVFVGTFVLVFAIGALGAVVIAALAMVALSSTRARTDEPR